MLHTVEEVEDIDDNDNTVIKKKNNDKELDDYRKESRTIGQFYENPKVWDDIAFVYLNDLVNTLYLTGLSHWNIYYKTGSARFNASPIATVTLNNNYYMTVIDMKEYDNKTISITFPGSNRYLPVLKHKERFRELKRLLHLFTFGWYKHTYTYYYTFRNANYIDDVYNFMRSGNEIFIRSMLKLSNYKPDTENIELYGYSLGGGVALFALNELVKLLKEKPEFFPKLKSIKIKTCSPTGIHRINIDTLKKNIEELFNVNKDIEITIMHATGFGDNVPLFLPIYISDFEQNSFNKRVKQILLVIYDYNAPLYNYYLDQAKRFSQYNYRQGHFLPYSNVIFENTKFAQVIRGFNNINRFYQYGLYVNDIHSADLDYTRSGKAFLHSYNDYAGDNYTFSFHLQDYMLKLSTIMSEVHNKENEFNDIKKSLPILLKQKLITEEEALHIVITLELHKDQSFIDTLLNLDSFKQKINDYNDSKLLESNKSKGKTMLRNFLTHLSYRFVTIVSKFRRLIFVNMIVYVYNIISKFIINAYKIVLFILQLTKFFIIHLPLEIVYFVYTIPTFIYYYCVKRYSLKKHRDNMYKIEFYETLQPKILESTKIKAIDQYNTDNELEAKILSTQEFDFNKLEIDGDNVLKPSQLVFRENYNNFINNVREETYRHRFYKILSQYSAIYGPFVYT